MHLEKNLFAESIAAMRLPVRFSAKEAVVVLPLMDSARVANSVKDIFKPSNSNKGFLLGGFLNPSPAVKVSTPHTSLLESVDSSSTMDVKEAGVVGIPSLLSDCVTPTIGKDDDFRVNGLSQSQKWPVGFGPSREVVIWEQGDQIWNGEDGDSPYPLGVLPPNMALNWEVDSVEKEDPSFAILDAFEEDFLWEVKVAHPKTKGRKEILNLVTSINYGDASASTRHMKGKARVL